MNIGFDAKRIFFNNSGLGNYSRGVVKQLHEYFPDNQYSLFTPKRGNRTGFDVPENMNVIYPGSCLNRKLSSYWRSYNMSGAIRKHGIDIYHGLSNELPADIRKSGAKSVLTMHDIIFIHFPHLYKPLDRRMYTKKYKASCDNADRIIAISIQTMNDLVNVWGVDPGKVDVVYQGCDPMFRVTAGAEHRKAVREKYSLPDNYILSVGTIEERKNLLLTVKAIAERGIDTHLVACGRHTPYADTVMQYATEHGIDDRVKLIHNVNFTDLPAIYQMADTMTYASIYEGFGIPILEALYSRIPVITTKGGVFPETGGDACIYIDPHSTEEMADALDRVLSDTGLRSEMIAKGAEYALNFTDEKIAGNIFNVYRKLG